MKFTEEKLDKAFTGLLGKEGLPQHVGVTLAVDRKPEDPSRRRTGPTVRLGEEIRSAVVPYPAI